MAKEGGFKGSFRSSLIYEESPIGEKRRFLLTQKPTDYVHGDIVLPLQVCGIANLAVLQDKAFSVVKANAKRRFRSRGLSFPLKVPALPSAKKVFACPI